jgi:predicted Zn-dependent protease
LVCCGTSVARDGGEGEKHPCFSTGDPLPEAAGGQSGGVMMATPIVERLRRAARTSIGAGTQLAALATLAARRRDWSEALGLWDDVRSRSPDNVWAYLGASQALRALGRLDQAERLAGEARERFPGRPAFAVVYAQMAQSRRDWPAALQRWDYVRDRFPGSPQSYLGVAQALHEMGRLDEAEPILLSARERFPEHAGVGIAWARLAETCRDWPAALQRWDDLRDRCPGSAHGYLGAAQALHEMNRPDEAEAILLSARGRFPEHAGVAVAWARLADSRRDWPAALQRWDDLRDRFPQSPEGYLGAGLALRELSRSDEADAILLSARERFPKHAGVAISYARLADGRRDWPASLQRWDHMRDRFPGWPQGHLGAAQALSEMSSFDEAEAVLLSARELLPEHAGIAVAWARLADRRRDWREALQRWDYMRDRFPESPHGYLGAAQALREMSRFDEAEAVLLSAWDRFPEHAGVAVARARLADSRRDWPAALQRWKDVSDRFSGIIEGPWGMARTLRELNRFDEAEQVLLSARDRFPERGGVAVLCAQLADGRRDKPEALRRWEYVRDRFPGMVHGPWGMARALRELGRIDEADRLFVAARKRFPENKWLSFEYVTIAAQCRDWSESMRRYEEVHKEFPGLLSPHLFSGFVSTLAQLDDVDRLVGSRKNSDPQRSPGVANSVLSVAPAAVGAKSGEMDNRELMLNFESLGDNCEFGFVQRHFGAEPLGLLRWSGTPPKQLAAAIEAKFGGFGLPENTELKVRNNQYFLLDTRYKLITHTFIFVGDVAPERLYLTMTRRLQYLSSKFMDDVANSEKIFVYRARGLSLDDARTLHRAMQSYGDCTLLCVDKAAAGPTAGTVKTVEHGLLFGYVDRLWNHIAELPSFDCWVSICRQAYDLWDGPKSMGAPVLGRITSAGPIHEGSSP